MKKAQRHKGTKENYVVAELARLHHEEQSELCHYKKRWITKIP